MQSRRAPAGASSAGGATAWGSHWPCWRTSAARGSCSRHWSGAWIAAPGLGGVAGSAALIAAVLTYYGSYELAYAVDPTRDPRYFVPGGIAWLVVSAIAGAAAGVAGALARSGQGRVAMAAGVLIGAALVAEGLFHIARDLGPEGVTSTRGLFAGGEVVLGILLPLMLVRSADARLMVGATMTAGLAGIVAIDALREFLSTYRA